MNKKFNKLISDEIEKLLNISIAVLLPLLISY